MADPFELEALGHLHALTARPDASFRDGQLDAIRELVEHRRRVLVVQRTGWGKSAVYFIATKMLRKRGLGPTLLISPLLALMDNQVDAARRMGLRAAVINSSNRDDWDAIQAEVEAGTIDLLLVSEQRLSNEKFRTEFLPHVGDRAGLLVVDEVHCISDWGHDFRPHYRRIGAFLQSLPAGTPVIGCTATANDRVVADVQRQFGDDLETFRGELARDGLRLEVHTDKRRPDTRLAWLAENIPQLPGSGIVYCLTRGTVFLVADFLEAHGITCSRYVGGGAIEDQGAKQRDLDAFLANEVKCIVATSALGMGYDKPDVGFVIHYQMPQSAIAYYQQVGRAGRALPESYGILLAGSEDRDIQDWFIDQAFPDPAIVDAILGAIDEADGGLTRGQLAARANLATSKLDNFLLQLEAEGALWRDGSKWCRTSADWRYPADRVAAVTGWRRDEQAAMEEYLRIETCRMQFLRHQLDDPTDTPCGVCDNCRLERFGQLPVEGLVAQAQRTLEQDHVEIEPRKQWPSGARDVKGKIPEDRRPESGWALCNWGEIGHGPLVGNGRRDGRFADELLDSLAALVRTQVTPTPTWLTWVPSDRRPDLVADAARRLASMLGIAAVEMLACARPTQPQATMHNSVFQVDNVHGAYSLVRPPPAGPGLLFDDLVDSRWTMTVVADLLLGAGAESITPMMLASGAPSS
ncbi:MAG: RecQ family ATP-dependent DNA helicase [Actinomycetota bacterium]